MMRLNRFFLIGIVLAFQALLVFSQTERELREITVRGSGYHTNHPLVNDNVKPWHASEAPALPGDQRAEPGNSEFRFEAAERRMIVAESVDDATIADTLRSRDHHEHPVYRTNLKNGGGFTFASVIMTLADPPSLQIVAGPPDEGEYSTFTLSGSSN